MRDGLRRALLLTLGLLSLGRAGGAAAADLPGTRRVGPFEVTAQLRRVGDSGRFLRTGNPFGSIRVREYAVRWNGRPVELPVIGQRFWQVLHLPDGERPALLVLNGPAVHLVVDTGAGLDVRPLAPQSGSDGLQWLDGPDGRPSPVLTGLGLDRADAPPTLALSGGRWLYVRRRLVLDVRTLSTVTVEPWARTGQGESVVEMNASTADAVALSPRGTRFVLPGQGQDFGRGGERFDLLMLIDRETGRPEVVRLAPTVAGPAPAGPIDAAWIEARFRWVTGGDGRERLEPR